MKEKRKKNNYVKAAKRTKQEQKKKKSLVFASDTKGKFFCVAGRILGVLCMGISLLTLTAMTIRSHHYGTGWSFQHYFCIFVCMAGLWLYLKVRLNEKRMTRFRYYRSILEGKEYIMLSEIERITGRSVSFLRKDISKMIREKLFLQANMNSEGTCLFLTKDVFRRYQRGQLILTAEENKEPVEKEMDSAAEKEKEKIAPEENKTEFDLNDKEECMDYEAYLYSINYRLAQIHDGDMMKAASDICIRGQQLLYFKETTMKKEVIRFLDYFLPLTDTILATFLEMEKEGLEDQTADLKVNINTIQHSFALLVEKLIEGKRVDVEEEIAAVGMMLSN